MGIVAKLKGCVGISIDANGLMTKSTTWMLINSSTTNTMANWLAFQNEVITWAGTRGDAYKNPVQDADGREASTYTSDTTFLVDTVQINPVDGRLYYEVAYVNVQNLAVMRMLGNASASINNNNEITKSITYQMDLPVTSGMTDTQKALLLDSYLILSGTAVSWAGADYVMDSSSYSPVSQSRYTFTYNAKDMSKLMLGNPSETLDGFGQRTVSVQWRLSNTAKEAASIPANGETFTAWLPTAFTEASSYLASSVTCEPDGILGYVLKIEGRHVSRRLVKSDKKLTYNWEDGQKTTQTLVYQSDVANRDLFDDRIGQEATEEELAGLTVNNISTTTTQTGEYEVTLEATDDLSSTGTYTSNSVNSLSKEVSISMNYTKFYLTAEMCGYKRNVSNLAWYEINDPPADVFTNDMTVASLESANSDWTGKVLAALKTGKIGYSTVVKVWYFDADNVEQEIPPASWSSIGTAPYTAAKISRFRLATNVYAQPTYMDKTKTTNNILFKPWVPSVSLPVFFVSDVKHNNPEKFTKNGLTMYQALDETFINGELPMMDCSVTLNYKGSVQTVIAKDWTAMFHKAVAQIRNSKFSSYKRTSMNVSRLVDTNGNEWTQVTIGIAALMVGYWNPSYKENTDTN